MFRKLTLTLVVLAACATAVSAQAQSQAKLTFSPSAYKVLFGHKLTLSGTLAGGAPGQRVSIVAWPYGSSAPIQVTSGQTGLSGHFSFKVKPTIETRYQVRSSTATGDAVTIGVTPSVSIRELGNGHIWTRVKAGSSFNRRFVKLQTLTSGVWHTVAQKRLSNASIAVFSTPLPSSPVRVAMSVNQAGAGYLASFSHPLGYKAYSLTIDAANSRVLFGHKLALSGRLMNGRAGQPISIEAWQYGRSSPHKIATVKTTAGGRWSLVVKPRIQTAYRARWASTQASERLTVGVQPLVSVSELGNGSVKAHVAAGRSFAGRTVKLQQLAGGGAWRTIAQQKLNARSEIVFGVRLPISSIRVAMSVNQVGAGLLGTMSHPLAYRPA